MFLVCLDLQLKMQDYLELTPIGRQYSVNHKKQIWLSDQNRNSAFVFGGMKQWEERMK